MKIPKPTPNPAASLGQNKNIKQTKNKANCAKSEGFFSACNSIFFFSTSFIAEYYIIAFIDINIYN